MRKKWFYNAQRLFREWKRENGLSGDCMEQVITPYTLKETWSLRKAEGYGVYILHAFKNTSEVYVLLDSNGERVTLKDIKEW